MRVDFVRICACMRTYAHMNVNLKQDGYFVH
jgi:hypothetical protein